MAWMSRRKLRQLGFAHLGAEVKVSTRAVIYNPDRTSIGDYSRIDDFCVLSGKVTLGRNVHIAVFVNLAGAEAGITVSDFAGISYASQVFAQSDDYTGVALTRPTVPVRYTKVLKGTRPVRPACHRGGRLDRPSRRDRRRGLRHRRPFNGRILDEALGNLYRDAGPLAAETPPRPPAAGRAVSEATPGLMRWRNSTA